MPLILLTIPQPSATALCPNTWFPNAVEFGVLRWTPVTSVDIIDNTPRSLSHLAHCGWQSAFVVRVRGGTTRHPRSPSATHSAWCNKHNEAARDQPVRAAFIDTHLAAISSHQLHCCVWCKHNDTTVGGRTYCENVYLSGRHRQKWLYIRMSSRPAFTIQQEECNHSQYGHLKAAPPRCRRAALHHTAQPAGSSPDLLHSWSEEKKINIFFMFVICFLIQILDSQKEIQAKWTIKLNCVESANILNNQSVSFC